MNTYKLIKYMLNKKQTPDQIKERIKDMSEIESCSNLSENTKLWAKLIRLRLEKIINNENKIS